jgi:hypothetical protein
LVGEPGGSFYYINPNGEIVIHSSQIGHAVEFFIGQDFEHGLAGIRIDGQTGYIDEQVAGFGKLLIRIGLRILIKTD